MDLIVCFSRLMQSRWCGYLVRYIYVIHSFGLGQMEAFELAGHLFTYKQTTPCTTIQKFDKKQVPHSDMPQRSRIGRAITIIAVAQYVDKGQKS